MKNAILVLCLLIPSALFAAETPEPPADLTTPPANAERHESGLATLVLEEGDGTERPDASDVVKIDYTVWSSEGRLVAQVPGDGAVPLAIENMLPGWREAALMMVEGETRRAWVPAELGGGKIPEGQSFLFDTTLVEIIQAPQAPADVAEPPADAQNTDSGLAYKVLRPGTGDEHPKARSRVVVHYTGWTTDGKMFDSSVLRGQPAEFGLNQVIKGWTEGVQLMTVGEKTRFWIPAKLAYGNQRGKPQGMLVFDVELLEIR